MTVALFSWAGSAAGWEAPAAPEGSVRATVSVRGPDCQAPLFDTQTLLALLRLELGRELAIEPATGLPEAPAVRVELHSSSCDPEGAEVRVDILHAEAPLRVALDGVPPAARARTLALLIAEALRGVELANRDATSEPPGGASTVPNALAESPEWISPELGELYHKSDPYPLTAQLRLRGLLQARYLTAESDLLVGVEGGVSGALMPSLDWALDLSYARGETFFDGATIDWWNAGIGLDVSPARLQALRIAGRLSLGRVVLVWDPLGVGTDHLVPTFGARATLRVPPRAATAFDVMLDAAHTLALTSLNGAPAPSRIQGWVVSWGVGVAFSP